MGALRGQRMHPKSYRKGQGLDLNPDLPTRKPNCPVTLLSIGSEKGLRWGWG